MIPPAMTADEWRNVLPGLGLAGCDIAALAVRNPHELAARALYGQPFGFNRAHLANLRYELAGDEYKPPFGVADLAALQAAGLPKFVGAWSKADYRITGPLLFGLGDEAAFRLAALVPHELTDEYAVPEGYNEVAHGFVPSCLRMEQWDRMLPGLGLEGVDVAQLPAQVIAARALYGQPFGFSRAHLAAVRLMSANATDPDWMAMGDDLPEIGERFPGLAVEAIDRLAALLPPD